MEKAGKKPIFYLIIKNSKPSIFVVHLQTVSTKFNLTYEIFTSNRHFFHNFCDGSD